MCAVKKMNPPLWFLSALPTQLWHRGKLQCGSQYIYVSNLTTPFPHAHTCFIHHFDNLHKQTVLIFFKLFSQIECDVELIISVRQELEGVHGDGAFIRLSTQLPPHCIRDSSTNRIPSLISCVIVCFLLSDGWLLLLGSKYSFHIVHRSCIFFPASHHYYTHCSSAFLGNLLQTTSLPSSPPSPDYL